VNRRGFLSTLATFAAGAVLDPEFLIWRPSAKTIFLPSAKAGVITLPSPVLGDVFTIAGVFAVNPTTGRKTDFLQQFVVTGVAESDRILSVFPSVRPPIGAKAQYVGSR
jgi:hypothetical protein